jgi:hypothetical protein
MVDRTNETNQHLSNLIQYVDGLGVRKKTHTVGKQQLSFKFGGGAQSDVKILDQLPTGPACCALGDVARN